MASMTIEEIDQRVEEINSRRAELDKEFEGQAFSEEARTEWNKILEERDEVLLPLKKELELRAEEITAGAREGKTENGDGADFQIQRPGSVRGNDIYDLTTVRATSDSPLGQKSELRDRVLRAVETASFAHPDADKNKEAVRAHVERLVETTKEVVPGQAARYMLEVGSPLYKRAFGRLCTGKPVSSEEQRALSTAGSGGGFAVPLTLDPTIIPTSNSVVNPARAISRVVSITGSNTWNGVTSPAITASRVAEAGAATDNAPTLVQPTATVTKTHAFVPYSVEIGEDWSGLESEFASLLQDAKDDEEGAAFVTGAGSGVNPQGFVTGTTNTFAASTGLTVTAKNVYDFEASLPPRFRDRSSIVANRGIYNVIRAIDTAGGAALWLYVSQGLVTQAPTPGNTGATLVGRGAWEASAMQATVVNATKIMVIGDFNYFLILDRIGMTVQNIPFLFGASQGNLPTGQQGIYCWWRNTSKVLSANAFVAMTGTT